MSGYVGQDTPETFLPTSEVFPEDNKQFLDRLNTIYTDIAKQTNCREIARYEATEILTGQQFFDAANAQNRKSTYRKVFYFGVIAGGAFLNIPHGITDVPSAANPTGKVRFTRIYGTYLDDSWYQKPIPYAAYNLANIGFQFDIKIDDINILLANGTLGTAVPTKSGIVVLEYLKN